MTASKAIATEIMHTVDPNLAGGDGAAFGRLSLSMGPFAHPPQDIASFEATIAPLFLVACAMFPFVVQIAEVVFVWMMCVWICTCVCVHIRM